MMLSIYRGFVATGVAVSCLLAAAGCGDDDDSDANGSESDDGTTSALPLQEWWASVAGSGEARRDLEQQAENVIAECMQVQGFDYTPLEPHPGAVGATGGSGPWSLSAQDFAEQYGYGLFTIEDTPGVDDPNGALLLAMSESEREAYVSTLSDEGGCIDEAWSRVFDQAANDELLALEDEVISLEERVDEDRRVQDAAQQWASCMADENPELEDLSTPDDAVELISVKFEELMPEAAAYADRESIPLVDGSMVHRMRGIALSALDQSMLEQLRQFEIEVATADYDCRADYDRVHHQVQVELEEQFMEENASTLERIAEAQGADG